MFSKLLNWNKPEEEKEEDELKKQIAQVQQEIKYAYGRLDMVTDPDMIDSCIYELKSLQSKYNHLIQKIKKSA